MRGQAVIEHRKDENRLTVLTAHRTMAEATVCELS